LRNGSQSHSGVQALKGAVTGPDIRCSYSGLSGEGDPLVADINGDGLNEIVFASYSPTTLWAFRGSDCGVLWSSSIGSTGWGTAAVGELNPSIPGLEVVATNWNGGVYAFRGTDGSLIWSRTLDSPYLQSSVVIADVDGDGYGEVFVHSTARIYMLRGTDGSTVWSFPLLGRYNSPAVYDVNLDSDYEVVAVDSSGTLWVFDARSGVVDYFVDIDTTEGSPAIADIDGDGSPDIVVGTKTGRVYAIDGLTDIVLWDVSIGMNNRAFPTIYDINDDGEVEVLIGDTDGDQVYALRGIDGSVLWSYSRERSYEQAMARKIGDIDDDGDIEIIITSYGSRTGTSPMFVVLNGRTGTPEWSYDIAGKGLEGASIGDVDNDGCMEIIVVSDWTSGVGLKVFDSATPVSDCGVIGQRDPLNASEASSGAVYLRTEWTGGGLAVETGRTVWLSVYSSDGRLVRRLRVSGRALLDLPEGVYILKVEGHNLSETVISR